MGDMQIYDGCSMLADAIKYAADKYYEVKKLEVENAQLAVDAIKELSEDHITQVLQNNN